ncbi:MAG TPA: ABC transporter ATP-binding protein [Aggregatilineaceae bacterium]|nr:ABC transporter ATP-binding protein [Aggregatilineaceae bacterium]
MSSIPMLFTLKNTPSESRLAGIWHMMTGFRLAYLGATISLAFANIAKTSTFLLIAYFTDHVLGKESQLLPLVALGFVVLAAIEGGFTFLSGALAARTAEGITQRLRNYLFDHVQRLTFTYHDNNQTGELLQRSTSDVDALRRFFADQAIGLGRIVLIFVINLIALMSLHWKLALLSVVIIPLVVLISFFFFRRISKAYEAFQEQEAVLSTTLQENLTGMRVVKAFARQDYERAHFEQDNWEKFLRGKRLTFMHSFYWPISDLLCGFQTMAALAAGALLVIDGQITVGTYLAFSGMVVWVIWPIRDLGRVIVQTSTGLVSFGRVMEIIKEDRELLGEADIPPVSSLRGEIAFDGVSFEYDTDAQVLQDITFRCLPGQVIALLGSTGSGKTTLVKLLPRFYEYTSGSLTLDGIELTAFPRHFLRKQIGIVEQEPFLFSRSIRENITYGVGHKVSMEEVEAAARSAAIHDVIMTFPEGYETIVGEKGVTLSGGQKQRVAIARTLLKNPRILILDDATSSVDTETESSIRDALQQLMHDRTTFVIAHRIQSVMDADLILVMDKGHIVQRGTHVDLVSEPGIYRQIYDMQSRVEIELEREITSV